MAPENNIRPKCILYMTKCNVRYIGETKQKLKKQILDEHRRYFRNKMQYATRDI